jgi:hypothetical protein
VVLVVTGEPIFLRTRYVIPPSDGAADGDDDEDEDDARREREAKRLRALADGLAVEARMAREGVDPLEALLPQETRAALDRFARGSSDAGLGFDGGSRDDRGGCNDGSHSGDGGGGAVLADAGSATADAGDSHDDRAKDINSLTLGRFTDAETRVPLLRACAMAYRNLQTHSDGGVVSVQRCPRHTALKSLVGEAAADAVAALYHAPNEEASGSRLDPVNLPPDTDRQHRTLVHRAISHHYGKVCDCSCIVSDPSPQPHAHEDEDAQK